MGFFAAWENFVMGLGATGLEDVLPRLALNAVPGVVAGSHGQQEEQQKKGARQKGFHER